MHVLYYNALGFNARIEAEKKGIISAQAVLDFLKEIENLPFSFSQLAEIVRKKSPFLKILLAATLEDTKFFGRLLKKKALVELMDVDFDHFDKLCEDCQKYLSSLQFYALKNTIIIFDPEKAAELKDAYTIYAKNSAQKEFDENLKNAAAALTKLNLSFKKAYGNNYGISNRDTFSRYFFLDESSVKISERFYLENRFPE